MHKRIYQRLLSPIEIPYNFLMENLWNMNQCCICRHGLSMVHYNLCIPYNFHSWARPSKHLIPVKIPVGIKIRLHRLFFPRIFHSLKYAKNRSHRNKILIASCKMLNKILQDPFQDLNKTPQDLDNILVKSCRES